MGRKSTKGAAILELLKTKPMSAVQMAEKIGCLSQEVSGAIAFMRKAAKKKGLPKPVYIKDWEFPSRENGGRENAVWAIGDKPDKEKQGGRAAGYLRHKDARNARRRAKRVEKVGHLETQNTIRRVKYVAGQEAETGEIQSVTSFQVLRTRSKNPFAVLIAQIV